MSTENAPLDRSTAIRNTASSGQQQRHRKVRYSKDDALDDREFEQILKACYVSLDEYWSLQCRFVIHLAGRLGMRAGEISHMTADWIDWRRRMIVVPRHEECTNGRGGGICGYCRQNAQQMAEIRTEEALDDLYASLGPDDVLEPTRRGLEAVVLPEDLYHLFWKSKTDAAAREIPFDEVTRAELTLEEYFEQHDEYVGSRTTVNRRVKRAAKAAPELDEESIYPHALRSSAASYWAAKDIDGYSLQALMGWADISTSRRYIASSGERTARAMRSVR